jgi:hypothetical protein
MYFIIWHWRVLGQQRGLIDGRQAYRDIAGEASARGVIVGKARAFMPDTVAQPLIGLREMGSKSNNRIYGDCPHE